MPSLPEDLLIPLRISSDAQMVQHGGSLPDRHPHLDSLSRVLRHDRVQAILKPMLAGQDLGDISQDDLQFVIDLGLCRLSAEGRLVVANPIYQQLMS